MGCVILPRLTVAENRGKTASLSSELRNWPMSQAAFHKPIVVKEITGHGSTEPALTEPTPEFSPVVGGPLYQLYLRTKLATVPLDHVGRRIIALWSICWLPPFFLSLFAGSALDGVHIPFLRDYGPNVRFFCALPLLIGAEIVVHRRIPNIVREFYDRNIIAAADRERFDNLIASIVRVRNSALIETLLVIVAFGSYWMWQEYAALGGSTWYVVKANGGMHFTTAGYWYILISLPILRFLIFRWYFRFALWYWFLWRVRGFPLHLNLLHPDRAGGLGFLSGSALAFSPVVVGQSTIAAGVIADEIRYAGMTLPAFKMEIVAAVVFLLLVVLTPLSFFMLQLNKAGRKAKTKYGNLASQYVDDFWNKWIEEKNASGKEPVLGTSDIQSLADLANSYSVVSKMRVAPIGKDTIIRLAILVLLPLLPLTLTMFPLNLIVSRLIKLVL
jgi:hypothetical protein